MKQPMKRSNVVCELTVEVQKQKEESRDGVSNHANRLVEATRQQHSRLSRVPSHRLHLVLMVVQGRTGKKKQKGSIQLLQQRRG